MCDEIVHMDPESDPGEIAQLPRDYKTKLSTPPNCPLDTRMDKVVGAVVRA